MRKLRRIRAEKGLTMDVLEERTGVSKRTISEIERGMRTPHALTLAKLANALGVEIDDLLEEGAPKAQAPPPLKPEVANQAGQQREAAVPVGSERTASWDVAQKVGSERTASWDVAQKVVSERTIVLGILQAVEAGKKTPEKGAAEIRELISSAA